MQTKNFNLEGSRSEHTFSISTLFKFVTVFNHSPHRLTFYPENVIDDRAKLYSVPAHIYLTLPLLGSGQVESCTREITLTLVSDGIPINPTKISLFFTEENNNINLPFPDLEHNREIIHFKEDKTRDDLMLGLSIDDLPIPIILNYSTKTLIYNNTSPLTASQNRILTAFESSPFSRYTGIIFASHACTLFFEESNEQAGIYDIITQHAIGAGAVFTFSGNFFLNWFRARLLNGGTAQTTLRFRLMGHAL